jgi:hypothetical protein
VVSDVPARLGPKAPALAWPEAALAFSRPGPGQSPHSRLGPGPAWPKPWLLVHNVILNSGWPVWVVKDVQRGGAMAHIIEYLLGESCKKMKLNVLFEQEREKNMKR